MHNLPTPTPEMIAAAHAARQAKMEAAAALPLKRDFLDDTTWQQLAKDLGVRLPNWIYPPEPRTMRRYLRKLRIRERDYLEMLGLERLEQFAEKNPTWPLRAWVGTLLEYADEIACARNALANKLPE